MSAALETRAHSDDAIVVRGVTRSFGGFCALNNVGFQIPRGALCGLIGPNGAGKTTLLSILATLDEEFDGEVLIDGIDVRAHAGKARRRIGFVPDHAPIYEGLDVRQFLTFFAHAAGLTPTARKNAVDDAIAFCGLESLAERSASKLSKGLTQRLCVARALLHRPSVLLLDEPASGLDPRARIELKELLKRLARHGCSVLVSSHILTELGDFCDHVVVLEKGVVKAADRIDALFSEALHARPGEASPRHLTIEIRGDMTRAQEIAATVPGVRDVVADGVLLQVVLPSTSSDSARLVRALVEGGVDVCSVVPEKKNLEALFLTVTKGEIA
ncbi:MAG: ABC transporter ATP-binding protein [Deltaproteobacteria bacterium]|nr:ABC transporter ATP-binding protein [Deltaproteobacteria bacterium]